ncbi:MAG: PaaI family thioesterase [Pseudomonadales bacterium]
MSATEVKVTDSRTQQHKALTQSLHDLIQASQITLVDEQLLAQAQELVSRAEAILAADTYGGPYSTGGMSNGPIPIEFDYQDLSLCMPYSPISGRHNAIAPKIHMFTVDKSVAGTAFYEASHAGPPGCVHGGIIAGLFDELLAMANIVNGFGAFTGSLEIQYHRPTPLGVELTLEAECESIRGRKVISVGRIKCGNTVTAIAKGLFIKPKSGELDIPGEDD